MGKNLRFCYNGRMVDILFFCLALALAVEVPVAYGLGIRTGRDIRLVIWTNCLTNPAVVYIMLWVLLLGSRTVYWAAVVLLEMAVVWVEYKIYKELLEKSSVSPLLLSVVCNVVSYGAGVLA